MALGVEVLVAQGYDAGGHTGPVGTMSLLPQIVEAAEGLPVLGAGGVATGGQVVACLAMGAQGGWLGTLWMAAKESHTPPNLLRRLVDGRSEDTVITVSYTHLRAPETVLDLVFRLLLEKKTTKPQITSHNLITISHIYREHT